MRYHSQNLNEKKHERYGWMLRHGRAWLDVGSAKLHWEWSLFRRGSFGFALDLAGHQDDEAVGGHVALGPLFAFYWGFGWPRLRSFMERITSREKAPRELDQCRICRHARNGHVEHPYKGEPHVFEPRTFWMSNGREIGVSFHDGTLWINLWNDPMEWHSADPKWWHVSINLADLVLGRPTHTEMIFDKQHVQVPMPEGGYWATVTMKEETWKRPRWRKRVVNRAHIEMDEGQGIAFPGKGENAWDCGEDESHGLCCPAETVVDGICAMTKSCMRDRVRHGGHGWVPEKLRARA